MEVSKDKTLGDYYKKKMEGNPSLSELQDKLGGLPEISGKYVPPKKLTFEEWANCMPSCLEEYRNEFKQCWQEAQKNV